ncbi:hypothetical protein B0F90DRAFT_1059079 [Multifurca ochricompacta]|uniref:Uncharacterized protein n=1 Tax=Multifurca ochricompacta TaxID=376703 RepID=A0AAD4M9C2_9AGAM|nr:hypothetical protein B0F90DRAFT_1059079 [Multifurca ochricompacta]
MSGRSVGVVLQAEPVGTAQPRTRRRRTSGFHHFQIKSIGGEIVVFAFKLNLNSSPTHRANISFQGLFTRSCSRTIRGDRWRRSSLRISAEMEQGSVRSFQVAWYPFCSLASERAVPVGFDTQRTGAGAACGMSVRSSESESESDSTRTSRPHLATRELFRSCGGQS